VDLLDHDGVWIARGLFNPASRLRVRLYSFDQSLCINDDLWRSRIDASISRRRIHQPYVADGAERLVFSESDLLSGLIVDRYADCLSVQFTGAAILEHHRVILDHLRRTLSPREVVIRIDEKTAAIEKIDLDRFRELGIAKGLDQTSLSETPVKYQQNGLTWEVDLRDGQKTGGYLDQRENHLAAARFLHGRRVLDVCCYTGGFGLVAAKHGASFVRGIDSSENALAQARANAERNGLNQVEYVKSDCFDELKRAIEAGETFDAVILDPPRFAGNRQQVDAALRAYSRLNSYAVDLLPQGGVLVTCSCSGRVSRAEFEDMLADVGRRRHRDLLVWESRGAAPDHPVAIACPESEYLKCVIAQVQ
jgi:23S rRNA (cytosine1962-C5)-methyltransferase